MDPADFVRMMKAFARSSLLLLPWVPAHAADPCEGFLEEINLMRSDPAAYAEKVLVPRLANYRDTTYFPDPVSWPWIQRRVPEGESALREVIELMRKLPRLQALSAMPALDSAAAVRAAEVNANTECRPTVPSEVGCLHHRPGNEPLHVLAQSKITDGRQVNFYGESVAVGGGSARFTLFSYLIDDGIFSRGHRNQMLDPRYKYLGIACGTYDGSSRVAVHEFLSELKPGRVIRTTPVVLQPSTYSAP